MNKQESISPLTIIAIFAGIIEASALASLPFLSRESQYIYTWFLVAFPFFLTVLFFLTLNFNYRSLWKPASPVTAPDTGANGSESTSASSEDAMTIALSGANAEQELKGLIMLALDQQDTRERTWVIYNLEKRLLVQLILNPDSDPPTY